MNPSERSEFDALMKKFCISLNVLPSPDRLQAYWEGLAKMSMVQFGRVVDSTTGEDGLVKFPSIPAVWKLWHGIRDKGRAQTARHVEAPKVKMSKEQLVIDSMFLKYLERRRIGEQFKGNIDIAARRQACIALIREITEAQITDWATDMESIAVMFRQAMERIPDRVLA